MWILPELSKWTESTSSLLAPWHAPASLKVAYLWEAKAKVIQSGCKRDKAQFPFSYSLCTHTFDQVHPTFYVQRIDKSLSLIKSHRSLGITFCCYCSVVSDFLWSHGLQHARLPCPSLSPRVGSNSCLLSYLTISSSVIPFSFCLESFLALGFFQWVSSSYKVAKVLELQHQSFQWIFRIDFLWDGLVWSPCGPRDSQESFPAAQFKSINSSVLSPLYGPNVTSMRDY